MYGYDPVVMEKSEFESEITTFSNAYFITTVHAKKQVTFVAMVTKMREYKLNFSL